MGEIKSTLDLVLEKTRHLTLSEEEKQQHKRKETRNLLTGLLQRYQDSILNIQRLGEELDRLVQTGNGPDEAWVRSEIMGRIELGGENKPWLELLQTRYRIDTAEVETIEGDYHRAVEAAAGKRKDEIKKELQRTRRISGSAVVPNIDVNGAWIEKHQSISADFHLRLGAKLDEWRKGSC